MLPAPPQASPLHLGQGQEQFLQDAAGLRFDVLLSLNLEIWGRVRSSLKSDFSQCSYSLSYAQPTAYTVISGWG